jgi:acetyl-CoA C-acetyltransferase
MGNLADDTAKEQSITREAQDDFAINSYEKSQAAVESGFFSSEIIPISIKQRGNPDLVIDADEEIPNCNPDKMRALRPAFSPDGTVTAANASTLSDGASCLVLVSAAKLAELNLTPLAEILGWGDAAREPARFTLAPALAIPKALEHASIPQSSVDFFEINEAFSVVSLANAKILGIDMQKLNVWGGGVSQGHPLGSSGSRIVATLMGVLRENGGGIGCAAVCNGAGGASAIVIKSMQQTKL